MKANDNRLTFKFHPTKGIEMEASNNEYLTRCVGIALLVTSISFAIARLVDSLSQSGLLS